MSSTVQVLPDFWGTKRAIHFKHMRKSILQGIACVLIKWNQRIKFPFLSLFCEIVGTLLNECSSDMDARVISCVLTCLFYWPQRWAPPQGGGWITLQSLCGLSAKCRLRKKNPQKTCFCLLLVMNVPVRVRSFNCYQNGESHIAFYLMSFKVLHYPLSYLIPCSSLL